MRSRASRVERVLPVLDELRAAARLSLISVRSDHELPGDAARWSDVVLPDSAPDALPDATLQVVEYPPIFVAGAVATPGQYAFRPGMTVLQAVAIGGGQYRGDSHAAPNDTIKLQSDLLGVRKKYAKKMTKVLSEVKVTRFFQLEAKLDAVQNLKFARQIPLVR